MDTRRRRFIAALIGFVFWVAALGTMAVLSGREPPSDASMSAQDGR